MNIIREAVKTDCGKLKYVIELQQGKKEQKIQLYIDIENHIYFGSNQYSSFNNYPVFDINSEGHRIAKEIFLTYLQAEVKTRLLELKQLELVLDELGLMNVIRKTIVENGSLLLDTREEIIEETIKYSDKLIKEKTKDIKEEVINCVEDTIENNVIKIARKKNKKSA